MSTESYEDIAQGNNIYICLCGLESIIASLTKSQSM